MTTLREPICNLVPHRTCRGGRVRLILLLAAAVAVPSCAEAPPLSPQRGDFDDLVMRFTSYPFPPVGAREHRHGTQLPYLDVDGNQAFDGQREPAGTCDLESRKCRFRRTRMTIVETTRTASTGSGAPEVRAFNRTATA